MSAAVPTPVVEIEELDELVETDLVPEYSLVARVGAEVFGTFVLVFLGVGAALFSSINGLANGIAIPLAFGIAVLGAASAVGHISGGHFNPAVSLGAAIGGRIAWADLLPYWAAQLIGGALGAGALFLLVPNGLTSALAANGLIGEDATSALFAGTLNGYDAHSPLSGLTGGQVTFGLGAAVVAEVVATAIFVGVILGVTDKRANIGYAPAAIGLTLAVLILVIAPITNASLNPARSTASAIFAGEWSQLWLFWVAPLVGAAIAALVYRLVTPDAAAETAWPELEPETTSYEAEAASVEADADAIDTLLARQAAAVPAGIAAVEAVEATEVVELDVTGDEPAVVETTEVVVEGDVVDGDVVEADNAETPDEDAPKA